MANDDIENPSGKHSSPQIVPKAELFHKKEHDGRIVKIEVPNRAPKEPIMIGDILSMPTNKLGMEGDFIAICTRMEGGGPLHDGASGRYSGSMPNQWHVYLQALNADGSHDPKSRVYEFVQEVISQGQSEEQFSYVSGRSEDNQLIQKTLMPRDRKLALPQTKVRTDVPDFTYEEVKQMMRQATEQDRLNRKPNQLAQR